MKTFKTIREAAVAGCAEAVPLTRTTGFEYGGLVFKEGVGFSYVKPVTSEDSGHIDPTPLLRAFVPGFPSDLRLITFDWRRKLAKAGVVASYHVHPCNEDTGWGALSIYFSPADMVSTIVSGFKMAYMAVSCTGNVYEVPRDQKPILIPEASSSGALGTLVATV